VLAHHYPETPNLGDVTQIYGEATFLNKRIEILVGGTPCQSFSVAGLRKALEDPRGNLMLEFLRLAHIKRPRWLVWENVPGVLSSNCGRDFGSLLGALRYLGYFGAWRVLDSEYFGVPQKRRRVFVVGHRGDWRPSAEVLFESNSLPRSAEPNKEIQQESPKTTFERPASGSKPLAFGWQEGRVFKFSAVSNPLTVSQTQAVVQGGIARKFTPLEYERLMGFPDNRHSHQPVRARRSNRQR
jgi:DNA (cytosine-5)-methyltransferase 1